MVYMWASLVGSLLGTYLLIRLLMLVCQKLRRVPNGAPEIAGMGILTWAFCTVVGGYGMKDGGPEPLFYQAFFKYYGPAMAVTVIELVRLTASRRL
jgi:hypothetical protein